MGVLDFLTGSSSKATSIPTISGEQQDVSKMLSQLFQGFLGGGLASPYTGQLTADMPDLFGQAFNQLAGTLGQYTDIASEALSKSAQGIPAYMFDEGGTARRWRESFAIPAMATWRDTVQPLIEEQFAGIPGGFYSRDRATTVRDEANRYFAQSVQPQLYGAYQADVQRGFSSGEAAAARAPGAAQALTALPGQEFGIYAGAAEAFRQAQQIPLTAAYGEYQNLLNASLGYASTPTMQAVGIQGQQGSLSGILGGAGMGGIAGAMGLLGPVGWAGGAALGAFSGF